MGLSGKVALVTGASRGIGRAVAERLAAEAPPIRITFAGTGREFERRRVAEAGFDYLPLPSRPWPKRLREAIPFLLDNWAGFRTAAQFLRQQGVQVVVGLGGYASVPTARAAIALRLPLVLLEQNAIPGRATRWLARSATLVCTAFHQAHPHLPAQCHFRTTGNPTRAAFLAASPLPVAGEGQGVRAGEPGALAPGLCNPRADARGSPRPGGLSSLGGMPSRSAAKRGHVSELGVPMGETSCPPDAARREGMPPARQLLILGGSGGAQSLNQHVPAALERLGSLLAGWRIVHQSGQAQFDSTRQRYAQFNLPAKVVPFVDDMPALLQATDLAICRAGGTTLAELAVAGVPAVLLPYPYAVDDHQRRNADLFAAAGACLLLDEREVSGALASRLSGTLRPLLVSAPRRQSMAAAMRRLAHPDAAWDVATLVRQLAS